MTQLLTGFLSILFLFSGLTLAQADSYKEALAAYKAKDYVTARNMLKSLAESGQAESLYGYGRMIHDGKGGPEDRAKGLAMMKQAADAGYTPAMIGLARIIVKNYGQEKNYRDGCLWYRKAAESGNRIGMTATAECYMKGNGAPETPKDKVQALAWYTTATVLGRDSKDKINLLLDELEPEEAERAKQMAVDYVAKDYVAKARGAGKKPANAVKTPPAKPQNDPEQVIKNEKPLTEAQIDQVMDDYFE